MDIFKMFYGGYSGNYDWSAVYGGFTRQICYWEIPLRNYCIETPLFLMDKFKHPINKDAIVWRPQIIGRRINYRTVRPILSRALLEDKILCVVTDDMDKMYYALRGAVLDENLSPLLLCTWKIKKILDINGEVTGYDTICPVMRVSPKCYLHKSNKVQKFIVNTLIPYALTEKVSYKGWTPSANSTLHKIQVRIEDSPFRVHMPDAPSINTTNRELTEVVLNHLDELE